MLIHYEVTVNHPWPNEHVTDTIEYCGIFASREAWERQVRPGSSFFKRMIHKRIIEILQP
jgi:hypothetical protein